MRLAIVQVHADYTEISHHNADSKEVVVQIIRKESTLLTREENGLVLQAFVFGDQCSKVLNDMLRNPMPEHLKPAAIERYQGIRI